MHTVACVPYANSMQAFVKHQVSTSLSAKREFRTMAQLLQELSKPRSKDPNRRPVFLFLGGGMAAGVINPSGEAQMHRCWFRNHAETRASLSLFRAF